MWEGGWAGEKQKRVIFRTLRVKILKNLRGVIRHD